MADKIEKALNKLSDKERKRVREILKQLKDDSLPPNTDLKKLKGRNDIYRIRKGQIRIIYRHTGDTKKILAIERRSDNTYNL